MGAAEKVVPIRARYEAGRPSPYHLPAPSSISQDGEIANAHPSLLNWARHLAANSSIIKAVLDSRVSNGIGCGLTYEPLVRDRSGALLSDVNDRIRRVLDNWRRSPDVTGELSGAEVERLSWRCWDTDGEIFVRRVVRRPRDNGLPYRVQLIESDLVPFGFVRNNRVVQGVDKDDWGAPEIYHIYRRRPDDLFREARTTADLLEIPADSINHLKRIVRPDQTRGITLIHAVVFRVADIAEFAQSHRLAARASADLFASVNRAPDWQPQEDSSEESEPRNWDFEHLQILDNLQAGEAVNFHSPEHPNTNATEFLHEEMRQIAAGTRSSFSQVANVFDRAYAAQRLEITHAWRLVEQDRSQFISDLARPALYEAPLQWAITAGLIKIPRKADPETIYDVRIDGPTMPTIDPVNDKKADLLDQENGWDSRPGIIRRRGRRPADVDAEREQDDAVVGTEQSPPDDSKEDDAE